MKAKELLVVENKKDRRAKKYNIKPRNPMGTAPQTGAGAHKDKKKADKQGDVKHKGKQYDEGVAENIDIGREVMSDTELDLYVPEPLQQEWRELLGYNEDGDPHPLWVKMTGNYEPDPNDPQHRAWMVQVANKWFAMKKIPNVKFFGVKDADDELEWLVQIGPQHSVAEGEEDIVAVIDGVRSDRTYNDRYHAHNSLGKLVAYGKAKIAELYINGEKVEHFEIGKKYIDFEPKRLDSSMENNIPFDQCPHCSGPIFHESLMNEKQDACYHKVRSRYKVWPSAYASGALVQCRKKGAKNWGNKSK